MPLANKNPASSAVNDLLPPSSRFHQTEMAMMPQTVVTVLMNSLPVIIQRLPGQLDMLVSLCSHVVVFSVKLTVCDLM